MGRGSRTAARPGPIARAPVPRPSVTRPWARATALAAYAGLFVLWTELLGIPRGTVQVFAWVWLGTIAWHVEAAPRHHLGFLRDWWPPLVGLLLYFYTRGLSDDLGIAPHFSMPIAVDTWLGGGTTPTERLQHAWCGDPCLPGSPPHWYDVALTTVYATHFVAGLAIAGVLWVRSRVEWVRWMRRYIAINFGALVVYVLYPMAPPWLAAEKGYLGHAPRITGRGWSDLGLGHFHASLSALGNPVAAMPSLHAGMTVLIAVYAVQRLRSRWRWVLLAYPVAMSLALVYFGEHYVVDVLAGALLAVLVLLGCRTWEQGRLSPGSARPRG